MNVLQKLAADTGLSVAYVRNVAISASHRYKVYSIPKRTGGRRTIEHPSRELKLIQTWLTENIFLHLPVSKAVYSYKPKVSIRAHANVHRRNKFLLRIDFKDFFPSIKKDDVYQLLKSNQSKLRFTLTPVERQVISALSCRFFRLTIGAPSSPAISNAILYEFDNVISAICKNDGVAYTRYADDLFFSTNTPNTLSQIFVKVKKTIGSIKYPKLVIHPDKTVFTSRKRRRLVTGIVLTSDNKLSVGRAKKRMLKTLVYLFINGNLDDKKISHLRGTLAYVRSVEPSFIASLEKKFGKRNMQRLMRQSLINLKPKSRSAKEFR